MKMTDQELKERLPRLVRHERKVMALVLQHLAEVDRRRLFLDWGHPSLFAYLVQDLKYSEAAANRRIAAARALQKSPEILADVEDGTLKLSQISLAHTSIRREEKTTGARITEAAREEIFAALRSKNQIETQKILDEKLPEHEPRPVLTEKHRRDDSVELHLRVPGPLFARWRKIKDLYSHIEPGAEWLTILELMINDVEKLRDPAQKRGSAKKPSPSASCSTPTPTPTPRPTQRLAVAKVTPRPIRRFVFQRDGGRCQHRHVDGTRCGSTFQVELDHIRPRFAGGDDRLENLQLLCRAHNQEKYRRNARIEPG